MTPSPRGEVPVLQQADDGAVVVVGESLTAEEHMVWAAGREAVRETIPLLDDALGRVVALAVALFGGGIVVARGEVMPFGWAVAAVALLFTALVAALAGLYPREHRLDTGDLDAVRLFLDRVTRRKAWALRVAVWAFVTAAAVAFVGVCAKGPP